MALAASQVASSQGQSSASMGALTRKLQEHDYAQALAQTDELLRNDPESARLWLARGLALRGLSRTEDSLKAFDSVLKSDPTNQAALEGASEAAYTLHDPSASKLLGRLIRLDPQNLVANAMAGSLAFEESDCVAAVDHFSIAMPVLSRNRTATLQYSKCLLIQGDAKSAIAALEQFGATEADLTVLYDLAFATYSAGRYAEAAEDLENLKLHGDRDGDLFNLLGAAYGKLERVQDALDAYRAACDLAPNQTGYYVDLVNFLMEHSSEAAAIKVLDAAIQRNPRSSELLTVRGSIYSFLGEPGKAEADFQKAQEADPASGLGRVGHSLSLRDQGKSSEAEAQLRAELRRRPNNVETKYFLAEMLTNSEEASRRGEARSLLEDLVEEKPNDPNVLLLLGKLCLESQSPKAALPVLLRAQKLDPKSAAVLNRLLQTYRALGLRDDAVRTGAELRDIVNENRNAESRRNRFHIAAVAR